MSLLEAALDYAEKGYPVFPCVVGGKQPITANGMLDATQDPEQIEEWWARWPEANIGLPTGQIIVIDVDDEATAWPGSNEYAAELAQTVVQRTPRGGRHYVYRMPEVEAYRSTAGRLAPKVDTRGVGGYIVVAPSVVNGVSYAWVDDGGLPPADQIPEPPEWLKAQLRDKQQPAPSEVRPEAIPKGKRNSVLASFAGYMRRGNMSDVEILAALDVINAARCNPPLSPREVEHIAKSVSRYEPDFVQTIINEHRDPPSILKSLDSNSNGMVPPLPEHMMQVPGLINDVMEYTLSVSPYPSRCLAFAGALSFMSFLVGRKVRDRNGVRPNIFVLALAKSAMGKSFPRRTSMRIAQRIDIDKRVLESLTGAQALEDALYAQGTILYQPDEFDSVINTMASNRDPRGKEFGSQLMKIFTASADLFALRHMAHETERKSIDQPYLSLFGTAIPKVFYRALTPQMLIDGFFARFLIMEAVGERRQQVIDDQEREIPSRILEQARVWNDPKKHGEGNLSVIRPTPAVIRYTTDADDFIQEFIERIDEIIRESHKNNDDISASVWGRTGEITRKLAMLYACSESHESPEVTLSAVQWGANLMLHQSRRMLYMAGLHVHENAFDELQKKVVNILMDAKDTTTPRRDLMRKLRIKAREFNELISTMAESGMVWVVEGESAGGHPQQFVSLLPGADK